MQSRTLAGVEYNDRTSENDTYWAPAPGIDWTNPVHTGAPASLPRISGTSSDRTTKAVYLQQDLTFADRLIATVGLRNDWLELSETDKLTGVTTRDDISAFTSRAGLTYKVTDGLATYASYAESVAPPALGVEPERGEQIEFGVKYRPDAFPALFSAAIYDLTKTNISVTDPITGLPSTIGEVRVRGLDLEAKAELTDNLSLTAAYSYLDSEIVENGTGGNEGNRPAFVPRHIAFLWANYRLEGSGRRGAMTFGLGARYTGSYYFSNANTLSSDDSIVFDAAFSYEIHDNTLLEINASNLFNEKHVAYGGFGADFYNPGRAVYATLRRTW